MEKFPSIETQILEGHPCNIVCAMERRSIEVPDLSLCACVCVLYPHTEESMGSPIKPVVCVAREGVRVVAAEVVASISILEGQDGRM